MKSYGKLKKLKVENIIAEVHSKEQLQICLIPRTAHTSGLEGMFLSTAFFLCLMGLKKELLYACVNTHTHTILQMLKWASIQENYQCGLIIKLE